LTVYPGGSKRRNVGLRKRLRGRRRKSYGRRKRKRFVFTLSEMRIYH